MLEVSLLPLFIVADEVEAAVAEFACGSLNSEVAIDEDATYDKGCIVKPANCSFRLHKCHFRFS